VVRKGGQGTQAFVPPREYTAARPYLAWVVMTAASHIVVVVVGNLGDAKRRVLPKGARHIVADHVCKQRLVDGGEIGGEVVEVIAGERGYR